jgi:rod shape-determining protein MreD
VSDDRRLVAVVVVTALVQVLVVDHARIAGVSPNLVYAVAAVSGLLSGPERGALVGFLAGLLVDLSTTTPLALTALAGCLVGYAAGTMLGGVVRQSRIVPIATAAVAGTTGTLLYVAFGALIGRAGPTLREVLVAALVVGASNAVVAPPLVGLLQARDERRPALR